jgi:hypothetical protein
MERLLYWNNLLSAGPFLRAPPRWFRVSPPPNAELLGFVSYRPVVVFARYSVGVTLQVFLKTLQK